ncbi:MAG: T9SS type A sorting domain-containing protein [Flavobacteriales bacterium]
MRIGFILLLIMFLSGVSAQTQFKITVPLAGKVDVTKFNTGFDAHVQNLQMPEHMGEHYKAELKRNKEELAKLYPKRYKTTSYNNKSTPPPAPYVGIELEGNAYNNRIPNDNDIAISNDGIIVSMINSTYLYYDTKNNQLLGTGSINQYIAQFNLTQSKYDPKVIYDPDADRFIVIFLVGTNYQSSKIAVAFSSTNNPTDPWNVYILPGNPLENDTWSDYPVVGINKHDLYIGINTFFNGSMNNSGFFESCFWQIGLSEGYSGTSQLSTLYYSDILQNQPSIFNITPMRGARGGYGPEMYLLSNRNIQATNDTIFVLRVSNTVASGNAQLIVTPIKSAVSYFLPPHGKQFNNLDLNLNDSRILGGFYDNGKIQFVQSCLDTSNGLGAIYHGFISGLPDNISCTATIISDTVKDLGFPNIASTAINAGEDEAFIGFVYTSEFDSTGMGALYMNNSMHYSPLSIIRKGDNTVNILTGNPHRWGDYSGIQRKYDEACKVWVGGSFGKPNRTFGTWIAECYVDTICRTSIITEPEVNYNPGTLFPNPAISGTYIYIDFSLEEETYINVSVYDMNGKLVSELWEDSARQGDNRISFSTIPLAQGNYILIIRSREGKKILTQKFIVVK